MDIASLGFAIDSRDAVQAKTDLDSLTKAGEATEKTAKDVGNAWATTASQMGKIGTQAQQVAPEFKKGSDAIREQQKELAALIGKIDPVVGALGRLDDMEQQLRAHAKTGLLGNDDFSAYKTKIDQMRQSLGGASDELNRTGISAKQTAAALRGVPAQFTDIAVSLQGGQKPLTVLLQQGGQLKDMFGGVGPAARALGGYVVGLINPFTLAAGAAGLLTLAYKQGSDEQTAYAKSIVLTGNYAGVTTSQLDGMAKSIDKQVGTTHEAADALAQLVASGQFYGDQLESLALAARKWEDATGTAVKDTVAQFAQLAKDPVAASEKLNEQYHYLTAAVYEQIRALVEQGRQQDAANLAEETYANALKSRADATIQNLGYIERAWKAVKDGAKDAWDAALNVGREGSLDEQISRLQARVSQLRTGAAVGGGETDEIKRQIAELNKQIDTVRAKGATAAATAKEEGDQARVNEIAIAAEKQIAQIREASMTNAEKRQKAISEYLQNIDKVRAANPNSALLDKAKIDKDLADIAAKFKDAVAPAKQITDDAATKMLQALREQGATLQAQLSTTDKLTLSQREQLKFEQLIADLKEKKILTADQKSLLASNDLIEAQLKRNVALEAEIQKRAEIQKLTAFQANLDAKTQQDQEAYQAKLAAVGLGKEAQQKLNDQLRIQRDFQREMAKLQEQFNKGEISPELYKQEEAALEKSFDTRLKDWEDYYKGIKKAQENWKNGASAAFADYIEESKNTASQTYDLFRNAFDGLEDALVNFVKTGKLSFKDLADSIITDLIRIQVRKAIAFAIDSVSGSSGIASMFSGAQAKGGAWEGGVQMFAKGGVVSQPTAFGMAGNRKGVMGEAGPEAIMPLTRTPDGALGVRMAGGGQGSASTHVYHINLPGIKTEKEARQAGGAVARAIGRTVGGAGRYM